MSNDLNQCAFTGRLGKDVDMRALPNGDSVASFSLAVGSSWKDKTTGQKKESVEWVNVVMFKALANIAGQYLKKGDQVLIVGSMKTRKWQDKQGQDKYMTEIVGDKMQMFGSSQVATSSETSNYAKKTAEPSQEIINDDDLPF